MHCYTVCVNYARELSISLPYNRHHFTGVTVITEATDEATQEVAARCDAKVFVTDAFHWDGSPFNKWKALEEALAEAEGWVALVDADTLWPREARLDPQRGCLYCPHRRMCPVLHYPEEYRWKDYPVHECKWQGQEEFSGYTHVFHTEDVRRPFFNWKKWRNCAGGDSEFHRRFPKHVKFRPSWDVLHLGVRAANWNGRAATPSQQVSRCSGHPGPVGTVSHGPAARP